MRTSPLDAAHRLAGAKLVPFGGWDMPLSYPAGTLAEHRACRRSAAVFDVSHLGTVRVEGPGAFDALQAALTNDLAKIAPGRAQYTHLLDEADGSVVDDLIVWWVDTQDPRLARKHRSLWFEVMPNASNTERVLGVLDGSDVDAVDVTAERALLAVQGPEARSRLATVAPEAAAIDRFAVGHADVLGTTCLVAGTGYTGEDGVELAVPIDVAEAVWSGLLDAGITPAGLGARDTLRLEAGLPLHGHELGPGITPLQAGLGWVVSWTKGSFRGRAALEAEREAGVRRRLRGLELDGRRPPRAGAAVLASGERVGEVTSGNFSPILERGIALGLLDTAAGLDVGDTVEVDLRGTAVPARVVKPPFVSATAPV